MPKYKNKITNAVNRFPQLYKMQAFKLLDEAVHDAVCTTADSMLQAAILVLIQDFGWGHGKNARRVKRFVECFQNVIDTNADYYDDAVAYGLNNRLHDLGIYYVIGDRGNAK